MVDEIYRIKDSLFFKMPLFDSQFKTKVIGDSILSGVWINYNRNDKNTIAFIAKKGITKRFDIPQTLDRSKFSGKWEADFSKGTADSSKAIALFEQVDQKAIFGTFLTETSDYRFLEGVENGNKLFLSCFDGSHAFLFIAELKEGKITNGKFFSGSHWFESWEAKRNDKFVLKDPEEITHLKKGFSTISFSYKNTEGKTISLTDEAYKHKVIIVQLMGTWCPNCMDETYYLSELYKKYKDKNLEIVALAF